MREPPARAGDAPDAPDAGPRTGGARHAIALGWAVLTISVAALTAPAQGIGRDEGVYHAAAASYAAFWGEALRAPGSALALADQRYAVNREHPPLTKELYGATHAVLTGWLGWAGHVQGFRAGAFLIGGLLSWMLATAGHALGGPGVALLAPALYWAVPRHFYHAHPAALDMPIAALWLGVVLAYRRAIDPALPPRDARRWGVATGLVLGAALAVKHNGWFLPPLLGLHWVATRWPALRRLGWRERLRAVPDAFPAMALGPVVLVATWPWLWHQTWPRLRQYFAFHLGHENYAWMYLGRLLRDPPFPLEYPLVVTALTVPAAIALLMASGLVHSAWRLGHARAVAAPARGPEAPSVSDEALLLLNALFPIALIAWPTVPHFGGVKHWLPAMPFLALLGARALVAAARTIAPRRPGWLAAALAIVVLSPAVLAVARVHPYGTAAYNELAGGAPGAAGMGMQRQFWGDDVVGILTELNAHAAPHARVWWQETGYAAVRSWQHDGRVRADLRWANDAADADISLWQFHQEFRDKEYRTWTAFGARAGGAPAHGVPASSAGVADAGDPAAAEALVAPRPVAGLYLDEVPLVVVYARPGAWR